MAFEWKLKHCLCHKAAVDEDDEKYSDCSSRVEEGGVVVFQTKSSRFLSFSEAINLDSSRLNSSIPHSKGENKKARNKEWWGSRAYIYPSAIYCYIYDSWTIQINYSTRMKMMRMMSF
jgi:hypothetical protein